MTVLLVDTSVVVKWFHEDGESEVAAARAIREATRRGELQSRVIDLAIYELGNVLLRRLRWTGRAVADQLADLCVIFGAPLAMTGDWLERAAVLGDSHGLTFYDAAWAAAADALGVPLVSGGVALLATGLAESPTDVAGRLRLAPAE